ncbi:MAG: diguanylate cyclase [bacterium]
MAKAKILVVEDSKAQADVTKEFLANHGYEVTWAGNGASAMKEAKAGPFDVILLDLVLPDINGKEVCRWLKQQEETKGVPVIMLTIKSSIEDKVSGIEAGADDYLPKPYNEIELNARIYAALRTKALQDELREKNRQVELLAITDPLTGLFNRRRVETVLEEEWKSVKRYQHPLSCLIIDIDHFKSINDTFGHKVGDTVLKEIADLIKGCLREVDTVARWGGEEFIVILPQTDPANAREASERIMEKILHHRFSHTAGKRITVSIGISYYRPSLNAPEKLVDAADMALYQAKSEGRNRIVVSSGPPD